MGNLSNLYISQSYTSLVHLGSDGPITTASVELQDGLGNGLGIFVNSLGDVNIEGELSASNIPADIASQSELNAYTASANARLNSLEAATSSYAISSSVAAVDAAQQQQINALISATGSFLTSSTDITSLNAFTASQQSFNASATASIVELLNLSSSLSGGYVTEGELQAATASLISQINTKLNTSSFDSYVTINDTKWSNISGQSGSWITESESGSFLVTASVSLNTITFTKGDASTFDITVNTGSGGPSTDITSLNAFTASQDIINTQLLNASSSFEEKFATIGTQSGSWSGGGTDITSLNAFTASQEAKDTTLAAVTASLQQQLTNIGSQSGSWITESETGSFAYINKDNAWSANQTFTNITAVSASFQYVQTTYETSSVIYSSGSNQFGDAADDTQTLYGHVNAVNSFTASGLIYPSADNGAESFIQTNGAGTLSLQYVKTMYQNIRNMETSSIAKGTPLFASGSTGDNVDVYIADAGNPLRMPATLIAGDATLAPSATGKGIIFGHIQGVDTTGFPAGTQVYVGVGGGWTATRPTGSSTPIQPLGIVTREGSNGMGIVMTETPTTLPNLETGYTWVGNGNNQPLAVATSSFASLTDLSSLNAFTASQETKDIVLSSVTASLQEQLTNIGSQSGSWVTESETGSFAQLGANQIFTGNNTFIGNTTVSQSAAFGTASFYGPVVIDKGISGVGNISTNGNVTANKLNVFDFDSLFLGSQLGGTTSNGTFFGYGSSDYSFILGAYAGGFDNELKILADNTGITFGDFNGSSYPSFLKLLPNSGTNPKPIMTRGLEVTGSTEIQSLTASLAEGYTWVGNAVGKTALVATSSFGTSINTGSFATTGSNTFIGNQTINGSISGSGTAYFQNIEIPDSTFGGNIHFKTGSAYFNMQLIPNDGSLAFSRDGVTNTKVMTLGGYDGASTTFQNNRVWFEDTIGEAQFDATASFYGPINLTGQVKGNVKVENNIYATGSVIASKVGAFDFDSLYYGSQLGGSTSNGTFFGYGSTDYTFTVGAYAAFDNELQTYVDSTGIYLKDFNGGGYTTFLKLLPNSGNNPKPIMTRGLEVTGSTEVGTFTASLQQGYTYVGAANGRTTTVATSSFGGTTFPYTGTASISGSLQLTGSASGNVISASIASNTASIDFNLANYFEVTSSVTPLHLNVTNIKPGVTSTLIISASASSSITFSPNVSQPSGNAYSGSAGSIDILSLVAFNTSKVNVVATKQLV